MKRDHEVKVRLSADEFEALNRDVEESGLSRERYIRALIERNPVKPMPPMDLIDILKTLQRINNNLNHIARMAHSLHLIEATVYWENVNQLKYALHDLRKVVYG
ncbi:MAG: plasmid mobilization relaxosome protein MobC [Clostridia bacterium]|nr:plasmid mobilization relaxosome protein MobC [Clostridia bacterium]